MNVVQLSQRGAELEKRVAKLLRGTGILHVRRKDIAFHSTDVNHVRVAVTVRNLGPGRSRPTEAVLRAAPLGAFVPWSPLTTLEVPELNEGESIEINAVVPRPATVPAGFFDGNPPRKLTAVSPKDDDPDRSKRRRGVGGIGSKLMGMFTMLMRLGGSDSSVNVKGTDAAKEFDFFAESNPYWAGNINVLIGNKDVERHMSQGLRIEPSRTNMALFFVGDGRSDEYLFELKGPGAQWDAALYHAESYQTVLAQPDSNAALQESQWLKIEGTQMIMLAFRPPPDCANAELDVHVTRRSTGQTAIVEFSMDPSAAGPGCYTV